MRATVTAIIFATGAAAAPFEAMAADVAHVVDYGRDGDARYYQVRCTDNRVVSLRALTEPDSGTKSVCFLTRDDQERCVATWTIQVAAEQACS